MSRADRKEKIKKDRTLTIKRKCELPGIERTGMYYKAKDRTEEDLEIMKLMDEIHMEYPFMGSRMIRDKLLEKGHVVNRKKVRRLMREMGISAVCPKPGTSKRNRMHRVYPYLLRNFKIERPNQVWAADITFIPMARGWLYLVVVMDLYSRYILSWKLSNSLDATFCVEALEEATGNYEKPEIFNTDQGAQFTSEEFTDHLKGEEIAISMDGKGSWMDNVFIERLWRSLKYEEVYLKGYESVNEAKEGIENWIRFYNEGRRHQSLGRLTPEQVYRNQEKAA